jgi:hypothetical protein
MNKYYKESEDLEFSDAYGKAKLALKAAENAVAAMLAKGAETYQRLVHEDSADHEAASINSSGELTSTVNKLDSKLEMVVDGMEFIYKCIAILENANKRAGGSPEYASAPKPQETVSDAAESVSARAAAMLGDLKTVTWDCWRDYGFDGVISMPGRVFDKLESFLREIALDKPC